VSTWLQLTAGWEDVEHPYEIADDLLREFGVESATEKRDADIEEPYNVVSRGTVQHPRRLPLGGDSLHRDQRVGRLFDRDLRTFRPRPGCGPSRLHKSGYSYRFRHGSLRARFESTKCSAASPPSGTARPAAARTLRPDGRLLKGRPQQCGPEREARMVKSRNPGAKRFGPERERERTGEPTGARAQLRGA